MRFYNVMNRRMVYFIRRRLYFILSLIEESIRRSLTLQRCCLSFSTLCLAFNVFYLWLQFAS